jgi:aryl-alcohol dehydrogenase-like predicted oxidoreductase
MTLSTTRLGRTGLTVSRLTLGTMTFGLQCDEATSFRILDAAADGGITLLDTADVYPLGGTLDVVGRTEEIVGRWLKGKRSRFLLATKGCGQMGPAPWEKGNSRKHLLDAIDASLRRLGTDYVDLYQLHHDDHETPLEETMDALDTIVKSGRARYVGASNLLAWRVATALGRSDARGLTRLVSVQPRYNLLFREMERELLPLALAEGLAVLPYNPLAGGLLTGKHRPTQAPADGTRFTVGTAGTMYQQRYWHEREFRTIEQIRGLVAEAGLSLTAVAIAWVLAHPAITSAIIGASRPEQLKDSLAAATLTLDARLKAKLDELTAEYRHGDAIR